MGLWTDEEIRKLLEEVEPVANWTAESNIPPSKAVKDQAVAAKKLVREALDKIASRMSPSWPLCVQSDCDDCGGCCG